MKKIISLLITMFILSSIQTLDAKIYYGSKGKAYHKSLAKSYKHRSKKNYGRFKSTLWKGYYKGLK